MLPDTPERRALGRELDALPACGWALARRPEAERRLAAGVKDWKVMVEDLRETRAHVADCDVCQRRLALIRRIYGRSKVEFLLPVALPVFAFFLTQPVWLRRGWKWTAAAVVLVSIRGAFLLLADPGRWRWGGFGEALSVAASVGAIIGLVGENLYRWFQPRAPGWGWPGRILAGSATVLVTTGAVAVVLAQLPDTREFFRTPLGWEIVGLIATAAGAILGLRMFQGEGSADPE